MIIEESAPYLALLAENARLTNLLRLAESSVSLLRADLEGQDRVIAGLAMELRRLRAAESPGTDDGAFEGTGWHSHGLSWQHTEPRKMVERWNGAWVTFIDGHRVEVIIALDAMRAAVPGSV
jgi:hypothetical protein